MIEQQAQRAQQLGGPVAVIERIVSSFVLERAAVAELAACRARSWQSGAAYAEVERQLEFAAHLRRRQLETAMIEGAKLVMAATQAVEAAAKEAEDKAALEAAADDQLEIPGLGEPNPEEENRARKNIRELMDAAKSVLGRRAPQQDAEAS